MRPSRGFTLIELLVVIAIIAILAAIIFPAFARAREKGRQATCLSNQKQLATAIQMYVQESRGAFPGEKGVEDPQAWRTAIASQVSDARVFDCPSGAQPAGPASTEIGFNFELCGAADADVEASTRCILTADSRAGLLQARGDVDELRHRNGFIASFWDGHVKHIIPAQVPVIFAPGDMGAVYLYGVTARSIPFTDAETAVGDMVPLRDGGTLLLTNESAADFTPAVAMTGGDPPTQGLIVGRSDLAIPSGMGRAVQLFCATAAGQKVRTVYTLGTPGKGAVVVTVEP